MKCVNGHKMKCEDSRERPDGMTYRRYKCYLCTDAFTTMEVKINGTHQGKPLAERLLRQQAQAVW